VGNSEKAKGKKKHHHHHHYRTHFLFVTTPTQQGELTRDSELPTLFPLLTLEDFHQTRILLARETSLSHLTKRLSRPLSDPDDPQRDTRPCPPASADCEACFFFPCPHSRSLQKYQTIRLHRRRRRRRIAILCEISLIATATLLLRISHPTKTRRQPGGLLFHPAATADSATAPFTRRRRRRRLRDRAS
jgi:hypothetical protein